MAAKNEHTGDTIATRPYSDKYGEGHDRIWGKKECDCDLRTRLVGDGCEICNPERAKDLADPN